MHVAVGRGALDRRARDGEFHHIERRDFKALDLLGLTTGWCPLRRAGSTVVVVLAGFGVDQAVDVDDEVAGVRIVDRRSCLGLPGCVRLGVARKQADDVEPGAVREFDPARILELTAEDQMQ